MKVTTILFLIVLISETLPEELPVKLPEKLPVELPGEFKLTGLFFGCERDVTGEYHRALQDFSTRLYKQVAYTNNDHFALSQYSIWLALSSIAEGSEGETQNKIFRALNLPQDSCLREKYYEIATSLESPGLDNDVTLSRKRVLAIDNNVKLNTTWAYSVRASGLIDTQSVDIKNNSNAKNVLKDIIKADLDKLDLGDAIILDSLDYEGFWTTAFENSTKDNNVDFFNDKGERIGTVEMMKIRKRVKLAHLPLLNAKLLELPVGLNGRYRMLFIMNLGRNSLRRTIENFPSSLIVDSMPLLIESVIPLEVAIPKFKMTSELDLKNALENIGLESIWKDANASKYISSPPTSPSNLIQRVTVSISGAGLAESPATSFPTITNFATGLAGAVGRGFTANRPFVYGLVDSQTRTWLFAGAFSRP